MSVQILSEKKKILGINSLGRIGKLSLWHQVSRGYFDEIVVNQGRKIGKDLSVVAQYIEKDSTYGLMHKFLNGCAAKPMIKVIDNENGILQVGNTKVTVLQKERNPKNLPWRKHGVEVVAECSGNFIDPTKEANCERGSIRGHIEAGAKAVINSSAFKIQNKVAKTPDDSVTLIYGINHALFDSSKHKIVSAASCTTTALAHIIKPLLENSLTNKILTASMSTIHAATNTQSVLDTVPQANESDLRKTRSILNNIILTSTNAAAALSQVIPEVNEIGFMADSIRIPTPTESLIILNLTFQSNSATKGSAISGESINEIYKQVSQLPDSLLVYTDEQNVSRDVTGIDAAAVIEGQFNHVRTAFIKIDLSDVPQIKDQLSSVFPDNHIKIPVVHAKIFGWYDNEYGSYTNRLGDLTVHIHKSLM